jgi:hypothetical protein
MLRLIFVGEIPTTDPKGTLDASVSCQTSKLIAGNCLKIDHDYFDQHSVLYLSF